MRIFSPGSTLRAGALSLLLTYTLLISLCAPFAMGRVEAATSVKSFASTVVSTTPKAVETLSNNAQDESSVCQAAWAMIQGVSTG
jgi:hypothetical protein